MNSIAPVRLKDTVGALRHVLAEQADALDGYPVAALVDCWPGTPHEVGAVLQRLLAHWLARLDHDLADLPPGGPPVLCEMSRRMQHTRCAMADLLDLVKGAAPVPAGPPEPPATRPH